MPLDRLFSSKIVTSRGDTQKSSLRHIPFLLHEMDNKPTALKVTAETLPASGAEVTYHLCKRRHSTEIPYRSRRYRRPFRDKRSPRFPALRQPANLPLPLQSNTSCRVGSNFSESQLFSKKRRIFYNIVGQI